MNREQYFNTHRYQDIDRDVLERKWIRFQHEQEMLEQMMLYEAARNAQQQAAITASGAGGGYFPKDLGLFVIASDGYVYSFDELSNPSIPNQEPFNTFTQCCDRGNGSFYFLSFNDSWYIGYMNQDGTYFLYDNNIDDFAQPGPSCALYREPSGSLIMVDGKFKKSDYQHIIRIEIDDELGTATATEVSTVDVIADGLILSLFTYNGDVWALGGTDAPAIGPFDIDEPAFSGEPYGIKLYKNGVEVIFDINIGNLQQTISGNVYINAVFEDPDTLTSEGGFFKVELESPIDGFINANFLKYSYINNEIATTMFNISN